MSRLNAAVAAVALAALTSGAYGITWQSVYTENFNADPSADWAYSGVQNASSENLFRWNAAGYVDAEWNQANSYDANGDPYVLNPSRYSHPLGLTLTDQNSFRFGGTVRIGSMVNTTTFYEIANFGLYNLSQMGADRDMVDDWSGNATLVKDGSDFVEFNYFIGTAFSGRNIQPTIAAHITGTDGQYVSGSSYDSMWHCDYLGTAALPYNTDLYVEVTYYADLRRALAAIYADSNHTTLLSVNGVEQYYWTQAVPAGQSFSLTDLALYNYVGPDWLGMADGAGAGAFDDLYVQVPEAVLDAEWTADSDGNWGDDLKWTPGSPSGSTSTARFLSGITAPRTVTVEAPTTINTIIFNNANKYTIAGTNTLTMGGTAPTIQVVSGGHEIAAPVNLTVNTTVDANTGTTLILSGALSGSGALTKDGTGTVNLAASANIGGLTVNAGVVTMAQKGPGLAPSNILITKSLTMDPNAALDIQTNNMIIDYTGGSSPLSTIVGYIASAHTPEGTWIDKGITSSTIAAQYGPALYAIGVIDNTNPFEGIDPPDANGWMTSMEDVATPASSVLVKFTWAGDADLDGQVTGADYDLIDNTWLTNGGEGPAFASNPWYSGDFNYDGVVNGADYDLIDNVWLTFGGESSSLPEPATLVLLALGSLSLLSRRRRAAS